MTTLYRKYRPQTFGELFGQNHIKLTLINEIETNRLAHAYLFCGPRAVGKTTIARLLAKALNCEKRKEGEHEPCNNCAICSEIAADRNMDVIEIDAASHTGVDNVRENIIALSKVSNTRSKYKVFIIDEAHMLSTSAFNALLKVLEEPSKNVIFILCTTEIHKVPATIISRCQRFDFKRINVSEIIKKLRFIAKKENIDIENSILENIARQSGGHLRDAESMLGQIVAIGGKKITQEEADLVIPRSDILEAINLVRFLSQKDASSAVGLINKLINEGIDLNRFLIDLIELLRKIMIIKLNPVLISKLDLEFGQNIENEISAVSQNLNLDQTIRIIEKVINAKNNLKSNFIIQLPVETAIIEICFTANEKINNKNEIIKENETRAVSQNNSTRQGSINPDISLNLILEKWAEVLIKIKKYNHSLSFILRVCEPRSVNNGKLCLAFKYKFHKDRVDQVNIKRILEKVIEEVYANRVEVESIVDESLEVNNKIGGVVENEKSPEMDIKEPQNSSSEPQENDKNMLDNLLKTFGGKVIE